MPSSKPIFAWRGRSSWRCYLGTTRRSRILAAQATAHSPLPTAIARQKRSEATFFDIFPLSPTRAGIFICDVMGHGLRAALVTAIIRTLLEELRPMMQNPGRFLSALNLQLRAILERVDEPFIATAFYLTADTATKETQFANAGHPPPHACQTKRANGRTDFVRRWESRPRSGTIR